MRKWILRFGAGAGLILAGTTLSGCLFPEKPLSKRPAKDQPNNAFNNTNPSGNLPTNPAANFPGATGTTGTPASNVNTRTSGLVPEATPRTGAGVADPANGFNRTGTAAPANSGIQPISGANTGNSSLTPIASSGNAATRGQPATGGIVPIQDPRGASAAQPQLDPVPSAAPAPVSIESGDKELPRYQPRSSNMPLMTGATEAQPTNKPITPKFQ